MRILSLFLCLFVAAGCVVIIHDASRTARSYTSGYDATDPGRCAQGANTVTISAKAALHAPDGEGIGILRLRRSLRCATEWPQVVLDRAAARALRGRVLTMSVVRPADNRIATYSLPLHGGQFAFGNQLGSSSCIRAEAQIDGSAGKPGGPIARTACR